MQLANVILAAGSSTRFGESDKLLADFKGKPLIQHILTRFEKNKLPCYVAYDKNKPALRAYLEKQSCKIIAIENASYGMGHSIKMCLQSLEDYSHWLFCPADMPNITSKTILAIIKKLENNAPLACAYYQDQIYPPAAFSKRYFHELSNIDNHQGAKSVIKKYFHQCEKIPITQTQSIDIDTPSDLHLAG